MTTLTIIDIVEQLKKAHVNVSLWDILTIPEQKDRLLEALGEAENLSANPTVNGSHAKRNKPKSGDQSQA